MEPIPAVNIVLYLHRVFQHKQKDTLSGVFFILVEATLHHSFLRKKPNDWAGYDSRSIQDSKENHRQKFVSSLLTQIRPYLIHPLIASIQSKIRHPNASLSHLLDMLYQFQCIACWMASIGYQIIYMITMYRFARTIANLRGTVSISGG